MADMSLKDNPAIDSERSTVITIAGRDYALLLTTKATKEIAKRYGGLQNLGDKLFEGKEEFSEGLDEIIWLITLLANQSVMVHNFQHPDDKQDLLDEDTLELMTSPYDLMAFKDAIMSCMSKGTARHVETEETSVNPPKPKTGARSRGSSSTPSRSSATAKSTTT